MKERKLFKKHYAVLILEAVLASLFPSAAIGVISGFSSALINWVFGLRPLVLCILIPIFITFFAFWVSLILHCIFKCLAFVNVKTVAKRIDGELGMRERMITMLDFKNDDSEIAAIQRADAKHTLAKKSAIKVFDPKAKPFVIGIVLTNVFLVLLLSMTTVSSLASAGILPSGASLVKKTATESEFTVVYKAGKGGTLRGAELQSINSGEACAPVLAVADEGYIFVGWNDGGTYPERRDKNICADTEFTAVFEKIDKSGDAAAENDAATDLPYGTTTESGSGGDSDEVGGNNPQEGTEGGGGSKWEEKNQIIDGATYYRDFLDFYYRYATGIFEADTDIPEEMIEFFELYFKGL